MVRFAMALATFVQWFMDKFMNWFLEGIVSRIDKRYHIREQPFTGPTTLVAGVDSPVDLQAAMQQPAAACVCLRAEHRRLERHAYLIRIALSRSETQLDPAALSEFEKLQQLWTIHSAREEQVLFPRLQPSLAAVMPELEEEHRGILAAGRRVRDLLEVPPQARNQQWLAGFRARTGETLDAISAHILQEEVRLLAPAEKNLPAEDQRHLAAEMYPSAA
ncbi:MAG: hemerythrin domain-containing protein [Bryobacteraceae bacterium]